jgi:Na+-driven multidrug efflux pump
MNMVIPAPHLARELPPRTRLLLSAPVLRTLLRLSAPNLGEAVARVIFLSADALFVSWLGNTALGKARVGT